MHDRRTTHQDLEWLLFQAVAFLFSLRNHMESHFVHIVVPIRQLFSFPWCKIKLIAFSSKYARKSAFPPNKRSQLWWSYVNSIGTLARKVPSNQVSITAAAFLVFAILRIRMDACNNIYIWRVFTICYLMWNWDSNHSSQMLDVRL